MSPRLHWEPVGPLPAAVYWRRRGLVLLAAVALLTVLVALLPGGGGDAGTLTQPTQRTPVPVASRTTPGPVAPTPCAQDDLRLQGDASPAEVPAGEGATVRLAVTSLAPSPCAVALGEGAVELRVLSGQDRIWSSDDCGPGGDDGVVVLQPGERRLLTATWDGRRSAPGCPSAGAVARPGTYRVLVRVGAQQAEGRSFRVV